MLLRRSVPWSGHNSMTSRARAARKGRELQSFSHGSHSLRAVYQAAGTVLTNRQGAIGVSSSCPRCKAHEWFCMPAAGEAP